MQTLTPNLIVDGAAEAIDFYREAFAAELVRRFDADGKVMHAELRIGDSIVGVSDAMPAFGMRAPERGSGVSSSLLLFCDDADAVHARAVAAGAENTAPPTDEFSGDRMGSVLDPYGHRWVIATKIEDVPDDEIQRRMEEWLAAQAG